MYKNRTPHVRFPKDFNFGSTDRGSDKLYKHHHAQTVCRKHGKIRKQAVRVRNVYSTSYSHRPITSPPTSPLRMDFATLASQLNAGTILPEGIVIATLMTVIVTDLILGRSRSTKVVPYLAIAGLLAAVVALALQWDNPNPIGFLGAFNADPLSIVFRAIVALSAALCRSVRHTPRRICHDFALGHPRRDAAERRR
jgi:hypothetical protein